MRLGTTFMTAARTPRGVVSIAVGLAAIGLAFSAIGSGASASVSPVAGRPVPADAIPRLMTVAAKLVKTNGGHQPAWEAVVVTTHAKALAVASPGDTTSGGGAVVYLITMKGNFGATSAVAASGAAPSAETYLSAVVNARTFAIQDFDLSQQPPPVAPGSLGPVTELLR